MAEPPFEFDVALSFAGEDRAYVHAVAERLRDEGVRVFYDEFMPVELWGEDLYVLFDEIFRKRARYVVAFISHHYVSKPWTTHERQSAQARSLFEPQAFLLPVRLDDSELPGLRPTVGHIDARKIDEAALTALILKKLGRGNRSPAPVREIDRVPRSTEEEAVLLANRPAGWEYLLFASILRREKEALEPKWRDHELGFVQPHGAVLGDEETMALLNRSIHQARTISSNVKRIFSPGAQERAFGTPGEPGNPAQIELRCAPDRYVRKLSRMGSALTRRVGARAVRESDSSRELVRRWSDSADAGVRGPIGRRNGSLARLITSGRGRGCRD